ncbi:hypothetical protein J6590_033705 [Homalodisca vitripennis]|nr:hypothetical protein J6590_033705 [Homalodisca vitripennis]
MLPRYNSRKSVLTRPVASTLCSAQSNEQDSIYIYLVLTTDSFLFTLGRCRGESTTRIPSSAAEWPVIALRSRAPIDYPASTSVSQMGGLPVKCQKPADIIN